MRSIPSLPIPDPTFLPFAQRGHAPRPPCQHLPARRCRAALPCPSQPGGLPVPAPADALEAESPINARQRPAGSNGQAPATPFERGQFRQCARRVQFDRRVKKGVVTHAMARRRCAAAAAWSLCWACLRVWVFELVIRCQSQNQLCGCSTSILQSTLADHNSQRFFAQKKTHNVSLSSVEYLSTVLSTTAP